MKALFNALTRNRCIAGYYFLLQAGLFASVLLSAKAPVANAVLALLLVPATLFTLVAAGLFKGWNWARLLGTGLLVWFSFTRLRHLFTDGWSWKTLFWGGGLAWLAWLLWREPNKGWVDDFEEDDEPTADQDDNSASIVSLVLLRSRPRYLEDIVLAQALSEVWGLRLTAGTEDDEAEGDGFVVGDKLFMVVLRQPVARAFMVLNFDRPYAEDVEAMAKGTTNLRFANAIRSHSAWLSVDVMGDKPEGKELEDAYRMIGKAIAALADDDTLAVLCPQQGYFNLWSEDLETTLRSGDPLSIFGEEVKAPVIGVAHDSGIEEAIAEARARWPEFVEAFHKRPQTEGDQTSPFIVKARFTNDSGDTEHMWLEVFGLEPEYVHGHLVNEPIHHPKLKVGSQVEVAVADVSDWLFARDGEPIGNFTGKAVQAAAKRRSNGG